MPRNISWIAALLSCAALLLSPMVQAQADAPRSDELERYTIKFKGKSLAAALGPRLREGRSHSRNPANGRLVLDVRAPDSVRYLNRLQIDQSRQMQDIESRLGRSVPIIARFDVVLNGVGVELTAAEAQLIESLGFVEFVEKERIDQLNTFAGPPWLGADSIWDGSATVSGVGNRGEGMIAAVIDSGINTQGHPSFAEIDDDGYEFVNPLGDGVFLGDCIGGTTGDDSVQCNSKLIGAYAFTGATPEDTQSDVGHGSHTASTFAGNVVNGPITVTDGTVLPVGNVSGVAPRANILAYRACAGGCPGFATSGSLQQALADGANASNYSIGPTVGGRGISPWTSTSERVMLDMVAGGMFVAASAGNTRAGVNLNPEADVANKGPWIATVANSTHGGLVANPVSFEDASTQPPELQGVPSVQGTGPALQGALDEPVFSATETDPANFEGCSAWSGTPFTGGILLVSRGTCNFSTKVDNAEAAGAVGVIVFNNVPGAPIPMGQLEATSVPSVMIPQDAGQAADDFIISSTSASAAVNDVVQVVLVEEFGNALSAGSLKGPNLDFDVTQPDLNGPGTSIVAANAAGGAADFRFLSGTSMSGPHIAGSGLLLMAEHPEWTPVEVQSALMLTANPVGTQPSGNPTNPDDVGSGTVDLTRASLSGLVMHETFDNFLAANPAQGGDPRTLNHPSMRNTSCNDSCSWTRTVRNALDENSTWTASASGDGFDVAVAPAAFELLPGDVIFNDSVEAGSEPNSSFQRLEVTVTNNTTGNQISFGELIIVESSDAAPDARMTISVSQTPPSAPPI